MSAASALTGRTRAVTDDVTPRSAPRSGWARLARQWENDGGIAATGPLRDSCRRPIRDGG